MTARRPLPLRADALLVGASGFLGVVLAAGVLYLVYRFAEAAMAVGSPFVTAGVMALLFDPLVDNFQRRARFFTRGQRGRAVVLAFTLFLAAFAAMLVLVIPNLIEQTQRLIAWISTSGPANLQRAIDDWLSGHRSVGPVQLPTSIQEVLSRYSEQISAALRTSSSRVADVVVGSLTSLFSTLLVPIITFYLLMDMPRLRARLLFLLPERARKAFVTTAHDVAGVFGGYVRGMVQVSLAYMVVATVTLFVISLFFPAMRPYVLLIGVVGGLLYVVPYIGFLGVVLLTIVVGLVTGAGAVPIGADVVALFVLNTAFDNIVTPRIVGGGVGLHPLLAMFALLLGASLFGLWGMLLAVPVAGSVQVVLCRLFPRLREPTAPVVAAEMRAAIGETRAAEEAAGTRSTGETPSGPATGERA